MDAFSMPADQVTVGQVVDAYCSLEVPKLCAESRAQVPALLQRFAAAIGAHRQVNTVKRIEVSLWIAGQAKRMKSAWTRKRVLAWISRVFSWALEMELATKNPAWRVRSDAPIVNARPITPDEFRGLMRDSPCHLRRLLLFLYLTGARPCEARLLRWDQVDLGRGVAVLQEHKTARRTGRPRIIGLHPIVVRMLQWMRRNPHRRWHGRKSTLPTTSTLLREMLAGGPLHAREVHRRLRGLGCSPRMIQRAKQSSGAVVRFLGRGKGAVYELPANAPGAASAASSGEHVFPSERGTPWGRHGLCRHILRLRRRIGLADDVTLYGMRHAFATEAIARRIDIKSVSIALGHSRTSTTEAHYVHLDHRLDLLLDTIKQAAPNLGRPQKKDAPDGRAG